MPFRLLAEHPRALESPKLAWRRRRHACGASDSPTAIAPALERRSKASQVGKAPPVLQGAALLRTAEEAHEGAFGWILLHRLPCLYHMYYDIYLIHVIYTHTYIIYS